MPKFQLAVFNTQPPQLYFGGVERRILENAKRLEIDAEISVYCGTKAGFKETSRVDDFQVIPVRSTDKVFPLDNYTFNQSICKQVLTLRADIFEGHAVSGYGFPKALKKNNIKKPFIHTVHGVLADEYEKAKSSGVQSLRSRLANGFMHYLGGLERKMAQDATLVTTISRYSKEKIIQHYHVDESRIRIVPNGVDTQRFKPPSDRSSLRALYGLKEEPCILFVGSLVPRKGLSYLIDAAREITGHTPNVKFLVAGDGPLKKSLTKTVSEKGLKENFEFIGRVNEENLAGLYGCVDVFVLPSIQEGQGIVLLEAQASGLPVVAFDVSGVKEAMVDKETGLLAMPGSSGDLAAALLKIIGDKELCNRMGSNGRRFVEENYTWDISAKKMLAVYHEALSI